MPDACDERFAAAMRRLTDLHADASLYRGARPVAERAFAEGLRVGDGVRRAVRQRRTDRPDEADCDALEAAADRIAAALRGVASGRDVAELTAAASSGAVGRMADLACALFSGLAPYTGRARHAYRAVAIRERRRGGEALPTAEDLARRLAERVAAGLLPAAEGRDRDAGENDDVAVAAPRPVVLAPSLGACGSEVALRVPLAEVAVPVLHHEDTGNLWIFSGEALHPVEVAVRDRADDEWWTASPVPYRDYAARLQAALRRRGVAALIEAADAV